MRLFAFRARAGLGLALACLGLHAQAADIVPCTHTWAELSRAVHTALTPAYQDGAKADLGALTSTLAGFLAEAGECQSLAQDHTNEAPTRKQDIAEWRSLNEWLYRLTSFVELNSRGDMHTDWKREFETFVEVYELAP